MNRQITPASKTGSNLSISQFTWPQCAPLEYPAPFSPEQIGMSASFPRCLSVTENANGPAGNDLTLELSFRRDARPHFGVLPTGIAAIQGTRELRLRNQRRPSSLWLLWDLNVPK